MRFYHALCPSYLEWTYQDIREQMIADWRHDCVTLANGTQVLEYDYFFHHMFNFTDVWTFTVSIDEALCVLRLLVALIEEGPSEYLNEPDESVVRPHHVPG